VGLKYRRIGAVALTAGLILSMSGVGAALAAETQADDIVFDGVVKVYWASRTDGLMNGGQVRVFFYRDGDPIQSILPGTFTIASRGVTVITGVPRAIDGAAPVLLDIRGDLARATEDAAGCTTFQSWIGQTRRVTSRSLVLLLLPTIFTSEPFVNCPGG
jgi:hypothetical protein